MNKIKLILPEKSLKLLKTLKGKILTGVRVSKDDDFASSITGYVLDFDGNTSIGIYCDEVEVEYFGEKDEASCLHCETWNNDRKDNQYLQRREKYFCVDSVEVVTDKVSGKQSQRQDFVVAVDVAIILHSKDENLILYLQAKENWGLWIDYAENQAIDQLRPLEKVKRAWVDEEMKKTGVICEVARTSRIL